MNLSEALKEYLKDKKKKQQEVGNTLGVSYWAISRIKNGYRVNLRDVKKVCDGIGFDINNATSSISTRQHTKIKKNKNMSKAMKKSWAKRHEKVSNGHGSPFLLVNKAEFGDARYIVVDTKTLAIVQKIS